jgi:hypothetical protein
MNKISLFLSCVFINTSLLAHEHVAIGTSWTNPSQLVVDGPDTTDTTYLPSGETFSAQDAPHFPGGCFVGLLTFTTEIGTAILKALDITSGYNPQVELISVDGPEGALFSFWERYSIAPTWSRMTGWRQTTTDRPSFSVALNADGHIHGRTFTTDRPGDYTVIFRINNILFSSADYRITFKAVSPPPLSIRMKDGNVVISFRKRTPSSLSHPGFSYDIETKQNLTDDKWSFIETRPNDLSHPLDATSEIIEAIVPINNSRGFFRIIEYY